MSKFYHKNDPLEKEDDLTTETGGTLQPDDDEESDA